MTVTPQTGWRPRKGDRVQWRGKAGTVTDDYWSHRDRFSVLFDDSIMPLDFGAEALRLLPPSPSKERTEGE